MRKQKIFGLIVILLLILLASGILTIDSIQAYRSFKNFPDEQVSIASTLISRKKFPNCSGNEMAESEMDDLKNCFGAAKLYDYKVIKGEKNYGMVIFRYACKKENISARFRIILNRTDQNIWCDYKYGNTLQNTEDFPNADPAIVADELPILASMLVWMNSKGFIP